MRKPYLHIENFTVFADADFEFGPGLNVLVGTNGTGKSHVLKLGYAVEAARVPANKNNGPVVFDGHTMPPLTSEDRWRIGLSYGLPGVFAARLEELVSFNRGAQKANVRAEFDTPAGEQEAVAFEIQAELQALRLTGGREVLSPKEKPVAPVFIPAKEILTLSWMLPAADQLELYSHVEQNYLDLLNQLRRLRMRYPAATQVLAAVSKVLGGELHEKDDKYSVVDAAGQRIQISMVAEGLRKFGTLQKLLANGSLTKAATLFWDEPEANLNPALLRELAQILAELARQGFQIILATHSIGLLKQFHILSREKHEQPLPIRYFGLNAAPGEATTVTTVDDFELLPNIVALDVELEQADDLEAIFAREDQAQ